MRALLLAVALLCAVYDVHSSRIFFPEQRPGRCVTSDGRLGVCVSASARRCALYPTIGHLLTSRPRVCQFVANDPVICCPPESVLPDTLGVASPTATASPPTTQEPTGTTLPASAPTAAPPVTEAPSASTSAPASEEPTGSTPEPTGATQPSSAATPSASTSPPAPDGTPSPEQGLSGRLTDCGVAEPQPAFLLDNGTYSVSAAAGQPVELGAAPWAALVGLRASDAGAVGWLCGGALVSPRLVVTAAHCVLLGSSPHLLAVRLGEHDLRTDSDGATVERSVAAVRRHPRYGPPAQRHDLALLLLSEPVLPDTARVRPVCLPPPAAADVPQPIPDGTPVRLPAFDLSGDLTGSDPEARGRFSMPSAQIRPLAECARPLEALPHAGFIFPEGVQQKTELCLMSAAGQACAHDSGGPVVRDAGDGAPATLLGLRLLGGCQPEQPEVTLRVDHYVDFIRQTEAEMVQQVEQQKAEVEGSGAEA